MSSVPEALRPWLPLGDLLARLEAGEVPPRTSVHHDPLTGVYRVLFYTHKLLKKLKYLGCSVPLHDPALRFARVLLDGRGELLQLELHPFVPGRTQEVWLALADPKETPCDDEPLPSDGARAGARADGPHLAG
jgi:hypothetical protein